MTRSNIIGKAILMFLLVTSFSGYAETNVPFMLKFHPSQSGFGPAVTLISKEESLTISNVIINKGHCNVSPKVREMGYQVSFPIELGYGQGFTMLPQNNPQRLKFTDPCNLIEIEVQTQIGTWTWTAN